MISFRDVSYRYPHAGTDIPAALEGVNLEIAAGEFVAVVGANGSGKSTLARMFNGLLVPDSGEVKVDGLSTRDADNINVIRETVGMVFQNPESQIVATTVADDIAFGMENLGWEAGEIERRIIEAAERFSVSELLDREPHWLSGGQKQRVVLAGVMAIRPRVLVLDEPTTMLDPGSRKELISLLSDSRAAGSSVIMITQYMEEAVQAPRLVALAAGKKAYDGPPREFFSDDARLVQARLDPPVAMRLRNALERRGLVLPVTLTANELQRAIACASS